MTRQLAFDVICDGGTDKALIPIINWAIHRLDPTVEILEPDFRKRVGPLHEFLARYESGSMLLFVHRDAEAAELTVRLQEFEDLDRRAKFLRQLASRRVNVASLIQDFSPLEELPAFRAFQSRLAASYPYGPSE